MFQRSFKDVLEFLFSHFDFSFGFSFNLDLKPRTPLSLSTHSKMIVEIGYGWPTGGLNVGNGEQ